MFYENYPCEIAVCKFSIKGGILKSYQTLIKVDKLPLGSAFEAKKISESIHGLPIPPKAIGNDDHFGILHEIDEFVSDDKNVVLFCHPNHIEDVQKGLTFLDGGCAAVPCNFFFLDFVELFHQIHKIVFCGQSRGDISYAAAKMLIDKDLFDSAVQGCDKHRELDLSLICSESIVKRLAFQFVDTFAKAFDVEQQPGVHVPQNSSPLKQMVTDLASQMTELNVETSDDKSAYESESVPEMAEMSMHKILNDTNPFNQAWTNEKKHNRHSESKPLLKNFGLDSDFDDESHYEVEEEDIHNATFKVHTFKELLERVRHNPQN